MLQRYSSNDSVENLHENKGYFCSELIASSYKTLGILPKHIKSAQYWPVTFSAEENLKLGNGAKFGDECEKTGLADGSRRSTTTTLRLTQNSIESDQKHFRSRLL